MPPDTDTVAPLQPQPAAVIAETATAVSADDTPTAATSAIDPVTARIMARRGVVVPGTLAVQETAAKKSERQAAPESSPITDTAAGTTTTQASGQLAAVLKPQQPQPQPQQHAQPEPDNWLPSDVEYAAPVEVSAPADYRFAEGSESQQAAYYAQQDEQADAQYSDDADTQAALSEGWWQAQHFDSLPAADSDVLDEQRFSIRFAAQVDAWARLIEQLELGGLLRLYLLNSALSQQEQQVLLTVARHQQHLDNPTFRNKVYQAIAPVFAPGFQLDIQYQDEVPTSPLAIQQRIEQERKDYVSRLLQQDPHIQAIQLRFAAELQLDTLEVN